MVEVKGSTGSGRPRPQDPGGTTLILMVRDIDAAFAPLKSAGVPVVTTGGEPIAFGPGNLARGVIVTDPDGHFVELLQPNPIPETTAPADSNIIGARVRLTVADTERTMKVYRDMLQIQPQVGDVRDEPAARSDGSEGRAAAPYQRAGSGSPLRIEFIEVKDASRNADQFAAARSGRDPIQVRLRDLDATMRG